MGSGLVDRRISLAVHFFLLEGAHEALGLGVVIRVAGAAHADPDASPRQLFAVVGAGVLHPPVGVMDQAGRGVSGDQGHVERLDRQARFQMVGERPADHPARKSVENDGQIDEQPGQPDISNVGDPDLIEPGRDKAAHGSNLSIAEHYTDTGGATDHVFALCVMLGFRFCPRLRDFPDRRLVPIDLPAAYPGIAPLLGKRVRTDVIREHWDEVVRLVASLKAGHVAPSMMLRKLAAYERQNQVDIALQEIGKIERTLFMLDWLENPSLRRRCQAGLNKSEQRHALTQAICTFRQGRIIDRSHEAQQYRASGLNLVIAAIVYWNSTYMADAVVHLLSAGESVPDELFW